MFAGKTMWLERLLHHKDVMFLPPPTHILVMYKKFQIRYAEWEQQLPYVKCVQGLKQDLIETTTGHFHDNMIGADEKVLLVLDDWMLESVENTFFASLYTVGRHYGLCGIVTVWHQIFPPGKQQRTISLNQHAFVLMKSPW